MQCSSLPLLIVSGLLLGSIGKYLFPSFYPEMMSLLNVKVFLLNAEDKCCLFIQCQSLSFCQRIEGVLLKDINELSLFTSSYFVMMWVFSPLLIYWSRISYSFVFLNVVKLFRLKFSFQCHLQSWILNRYCLNLVLTCNIFFLHHLWLIVLLDIIVQPGICDLFRFLVHLSRPFLQAQFTRSASTWNGEQQVFIWGALIMKAAVFLCCVHWEL